MIRIGLGACALLVSLLASPAVARTEAVQAESVQSEAARLQPAWARIDALVARTMRERNTPGMALAVTTREGILRTSVYGYADLKSRAPVTPQTLFEIGSISKSFTAVALLQLRDGGRFDPREPVTKYLPWFQIRSAFAPITGHDLLTHASGLPRDRDDIPSSLYQAAALRERTAGFAPGSRFAYSNINYQVLGYVIEEIEGRPYPEVIRERILRPLGMTASEPAITHETRKRLAVGYEPFYDDRPSHPSHPLVEATWLEYAAGDGSIASTPEDLAAYLRMLLNRGAGPHGRILSAEGFSLLTQRAMKTDSEDGSERHYGYGVALSEEGGHTLLSHGGGMVGYASYIVADLDDGLGAAALVNGPGDPAGVSRFALEAARAALKGKDPPEPPPADSPESVPGAVQYAGTYTAADGPPTAPSVGRDMAGDGKALRLVAEKERLILLYDGRRIALEPRGRDAFFVNHPDFALFLLRFAREKDTVVEAAHGGDWYVNDRYAGPREFSPPVEWAAYPGHYRTQHPWFHNFRLVPRKGKLWLVMPEGDEEELVSAGPGEFRLASGALAAETLRLDTVVRGQALRANLSGVDFYRTFTP